jgi:general secretion pathway protein G
LGRRLNTMGSTRARSRRGFSLLEVVIVVAIIAILAAIGIPRMSRGSRGANDAAVSGNLSVLRNAIDLFSAEHGGEFPDVADCNDQLTQYTDITGDTSATKVGAYIYGPYLRSIPPLTVGSHKGDRLISDSNGVGVGWIYVAASGDIRANATSEEDDAGTLYKDY